MGLLWWSVVFTWTLLKAAFQATLVAYPSYKTYKALEHGRRGNLQAAQGMLLYWAVTAAVASAKEIVDGILGTYANLYVWQMTVLALKAAPLIIGPERMYAHVVKPLFHSQEENVDAVVEVAHTVKHIAQDAVPSAKQGDVEAVKDAASEIVDTLKVQAAEVTHALQAKVEQVGLTWDRKGAWGALEQSMTGVERVRDVGIGYAAQHWKTHGPFITEKAKIATNKGSELYATHAPVLRAKINDTYQTQVLPRVQPKMQAIQQQYDTKIRPVAIAQASKLQQLWQQHGGPVRSFYTDRLLPFYQNTLRPFVLHSFLPALYETLIALKDRAMDLFSSPSDEMRSQRASHKRRRREALESRTSWKKRGDKVKSKWESSWKEMEGEAPAAADSEKVASSAIDSAATLTNRRTKTVQDSSSSGLTEPAAASPIEAPIDRSAPSEAAAQPPVHQEWQVSKPAGIPHEEGLPVKENSALDAQSQKPASELLQSPQDAALVGKEAESGEMGREQWAGEDSARLASPIH